MNMYRYPAGAEIDGQALAAPAVLAPCRVVIDGVLHGPEICELWSPEALAGLGIKRVECDALPTDANGWPYLPGEPVDVEESLRICRTYPNAAPDVEGSAANLAAQREAERARIRVELTALDAASARPLRAILAAQAAGGMAEQADLDRLAELEAQAQALRAELGA